MSKRIAVAVAIASLGMLSVPVQAAGWPWPLLSRRDPTPPAPITPAALQAQLVAKSGSDTVYFSSHGITLDQNAIATLGAQAQWLLANPDVMVRLEGHGDDSDTRDYALAIGARRASAVRDFFVLRGIAPARLKVVSWGKERPGYVRVGPQTVRVGARVVTIVSGTIPPPLPPLPGSGGPAMLGGR